MRILTFLYLIYIAVAVSACGRHRNTTVTPARDHKYIVQLSPEVDIENFIPKLIQGAIGFVHNLIEEVGEGIEDLLGRTYDRTSTKKVHVTNTVDIGGGFKALTMDILDDRLLEPIITGFSEILGIFPDDEIQFQLPKPTKSNKDKRYYIRYDPVHSPQPKHAGIYAESEPEHEEGEQPVTTASPTTTATTARQKWPGWTSSISPNDPSTATKTSTLSHAATPTSSSSSNVSYTQQKDAPWNLVRISERDLDLDKPYIYDSQAGEGVIVYVVDDGIAIHNEDFEGRAKHGWTAFGNDTSRVVTSSSVKKAKSNPLDGGGHGTHVAGLIGGKTYGVAKKTQLVSVQVLSADGKGTVSNFLSGLQWILQQEKDRNRPVIINMSLGLPKSNPGANALDQAVTAAVKAGLPVIAAAGNSGSDACQITPAGNKKVYTVGTVTQDDEMDSYSCYGKCVNILAPGYDVTSTYIGAKDATATMSGSSMAAPHVSGVAALLLPRLQDPTPENLYQLLTDLATRDKISGLPDKQTPNALVFNGQQKTVQLPSSLLKKDGFLSSSTK